MFRILSPDSFVTTAWKNGGGVTHEIAREDRDGSWRWRLSIAEVAADGPFSRFEGMSRILTVIEGSGIDLHAPEGVLEARPWRPVAFSGDLAVDSRMVDGPIRDLNVIYDARSLDVTVEVIETPCTVAAGPGTTGFLCLQGVVTVDGARLRPMAFALGDAGVIALAAGARGILIRLRDRP